MQKRPLIILLFFFFLYPLFCSGTEQEISVRAEYPKVVAVGESFRITFTVNASGGEMSAPSFEDFYKLSGPHIAYSQSMSIINGRRSTETSYSYTYQIQALTAGTYDVGKAVFKKADKNHESESVTIEVVPDAAGRRDTGTDDESAAVATADNDMFVSIIPEKREVYVGEPVAATVKFYTRTDISGISGIKYPSFTGFLKEEVETPRLNSLERESVNGVIYGTGELQRYLLYPQRAGEIVIEPVNMTVQIRERRAASDPFFGDFFGSFTTVPRAVTGESVTINVLPLPDRRPADFRGGVGNFSITAQTDRDSIMVNDAVNYKVTLKGRGNLRLAESPPIKFPEELEVFDPSVRYQADRTSGDGKTGTKYFEYLIIPRKAGNYSIGPVTYSYFDPQEKRYKTVSAEEINLVVNDSGVGFSTNLQGESDVSGEVRYLARDIRFIKTSPGTLKREGAWLLSRRAYYSSFVIAFLIFVTLIFLRREQVKRNSDRIKVLNRKAGKVARKRLREAHKCFKNNNGDKFFEEILRAIWGYSADKLSIPVSEVTRERVIELLLQKGVDADVAKRLENVVDSCEFARYSSEKSFSDMSDIYIETTEIINHLEEIL